MASLTRQVAHNTIIHFVGKALGVALGVGVVALMTRSLGPEGYGHYTTIVAYLQIFGILIDFGLTLGTVQFLADPRYTKEHVLGTMYTLRFLSAAPFLLAAVLVGFFMPYAPIVRIGIAILSFEFLFISFIQVTTGLFQKLLRMEHVAIGELLGRIILFVGILIAVQRESGLLIILFIIVLASFATLLYLSVAAYRLAPFRYTFDTALMKKMLTTSWPVGVSIACNLIYLKGDTFILSLLRTPEEVGIYGAPFRVLETLASLPYLFVGIVFPLLRTAWITDRARFARMLQKSFDAIMLIAIPLVVGGVILATPLMTLVAGKDFSASGPLLQILILATGLIFLSTLFGHAVLAIEKQRPMIWAYAATAAIALLGYLLFIPRYGALGAAWMTVVAEGCIALMTFIVTKRVTCFTLSWRTTAKICIASGVMGFILFFLSPLPVLLLVGVGAVAYSFALFAVRAISRDTMKELFT